MNDREPNPLFEEKFKYIEDIIDSRKQLGHYAVHPGAHGRYAYSQPSRLGESSRRSEDPKRTDSEITLVRVRVSRARKWDMQDAAVPGDGSHLGDSPSLVNLATLVGDAVPFEGEEYLVPLSSWEPCEDPEKAEKKTDGRVVEDEDCPGVARKPSWAGKISNFIRKLKN